jgi:hypothetical protein
MAADLTGALRAKCPERVFRYVLDLEVVARDGIEPPTAGLFRAADVTTELKLGLSAAWNSMGI